MAWTLSTAVGEASMSGSRSTASAPSSAGSPATARSGARRRSKRGASWRPSRQPDGSWLHHDPFPHTFPLPPPWASGITQGQGASLLVRLNAETGDADLARAARLALEPLLTPQSSGGVCGELGGRPWPEEYPTSPESHVLNGAIFALWGMRDVAVGLGSHEVQNASIGASLAGRQPAPL